MLEPDGPQKRHGLGDNKPDGTTAVGVVVAVAVALAAFIPLAIVLGSHPIGYHCRTCVLIQRSLAVSRS